MSTDRLDYRHFWSMKDHGKHDGSSSHASHHHHRNRYATHDRIPLFGSMRPGRVLVWALAASVLSTVLFVFASVRGGIGLSMGLSVQWLYVGGHLLGCFGNSVLPGYLSFAQWIIAKLASLGLAVMLYLAGRSKYRWHSDGVNKR